MALVNKGRKKLHILEISNLAKERLVDSATEAHLLLQYIPNEKWLTGQELTEDGTDSPHIHCSVLLLSES